MEQIDISQFESSLEDVRKAYRLLYLYQQRVIDIIRYIANEYSVHTGHGWSKFSENTPKGSKVHLGRSAWEWLNMYFYVFNMENKTIQGTGEEIDLRFVLQSDTGYYDAGIQSKQDVTNFAPAEESQTRLILTAGISELPEVTGHLLQNHLCKNSNELIVAREHRWIGKPYNLTEFFDQSQTDERIDEFNDLCKANLNVDLKTGPPNSQLSRISSQNEKTP